MTIVDAAPLWLSKLVARVLYGKEYSTALGESYTEVVEQEGGVGGSIVEWAKERAQNIIVFIVGVSLMLLIIYMLLRKFLNK
jgi:hypothetical protein